MRPYLVEDGGTLQIGIGLLGDAIAQALIVRDRHGAEFRRLLDSLCPDGIAGREVDRFDHGLCGCSEMFVNGFLRLIEAGIVRCEVFADQGLQDLLNSGRIADETVTPSSMPTSCAARSARRTWLGCSALACCAPTWRSTVMC